MSGGWIAAVAAVAAVAVIIVMAGLFLWAMLRATFRG